MLHVDYLMIATTLERCDMWQPCDLTNPNEFKRTNSYVRKIAIYLNRIDLGIIVKSAVVEQLARFLDVPMSKRSELVNTKKTDGSDLDHPRAVNSNGNFILTFCLSVCMCECVRASKSVCGCLPALLSPRVGWLLFFYKTYQSVSIPWGRSVFPSVYLFVSLDIPCPGLPQTFYPLCLKYDSFRKTILQF